VEGEGGHLTGEEEVLQGGDTRVAGGGGLQVPEGGRHLGEGAGQEEEGAGAGAQQGEGGLGRGQGRPRAEGATQAPHQTPTPPDKAAENHVLSFILVPISDVQMFNNVQLNTPMTWTNFVLMKIRQLCGPICSFGGSKHSVLQCSSSHFMSVCCIL